MWQGASGPGGGGALGRAVLSSGVDAPAGTHTPLTFAGRRIYGGAVRRLAPVQATRPPLAGFAAGALGDAWGSGGVSPWRGPRHRELGLDTCARRKGAQTQHKIQNNSKYIFFQFPHYLLNI